jgi:hypothetical protein
MAEHPPMGKNFNSFANGEMFTDVSQKTQREIYFSRSARLSEKSIPATQVSPVSLFSRCYSLERHKGKSFSPARLSNSPNFVNVFPALSRSRMPHGTFKKNSLVIENVSQ